MTRDDLMQLGQAATLLAVLAVPAAAQAPSYLGLGIGGATSLHTDQDEFEASTNPYPTVSLFVGRELWTHNRWSVAAEGRCFWWQQRAHGQRDESVDGRFMATGCLASPVVSYDAGPLALFGSVGAGPAYQLIDVTDGSRSGRNGSRSGIVLGTEVAGGVQVPLTDDWMMRARGFWSRAGELEQVGGGVEMAWRFDWGEW